MRSKCNLLIFDEATSAVSRNSFSHSTVNSKLVALNHKVKTFSGKSLEQVVGFKYLKIKGATSNLYRSFHEFIFYKPIIIDLERI